MNLPDIGLNQGFNLGDRLRQAYSDFIHATEPDSKFRIRAERRRYACSHKEVDGRSIMPLTLLRDGGGK